MSSAQPSPLAPEEIARDATWLAQALDPSQGLVRLIAMDRDSYRAESFLDDRMLRQTVDAQIVPWTLIEAAVGGAMRTDARWIFHIGHVGSTLLSRLIGELEGVLSLREPRLLRDLTLSPTAVREGYIGAAPKLMSRSFADDETACVKATSFVSEIAPELVPGGERALFMYAAPTSYIAGILAGENSVKELRVLADARAARMAERVTTLEPDPSSNAQLAAAAWACEMTSLESAAERMADRRIAWLDFDRMLGDVAAALRMVTDHFAFDADEIAIEAIAGGPLMGRYSKAPEFDYSPALRSELIEESRREHGAGIDSALAMLRSAAEKSPLLARALARAED